VTATLLYIRSDAVAEGSSPKQSAAITETIQDTQELLAAMEQEESSDAENRRSQALWYNVPPTLDKFYGREDVLAKIKDALDPIDGNATSRRVLLLHGMAGVGKTRIALDYVQSSQHFDRIFWISDELESSYLAIAESLFGYSGGDHITAMSQFRKWLSQQSNYFMSCVFPNANNDIGFRWLLVLDNVSDLEEMPKALPFLHAVGSVLITSRNSHACFGTTDTICKVQPFSHETSVSVFLSLIGRKEYTKPERAALVKVTQALGGLPLAIKEISDIIIDQGLNLEDFQLYKRNSIYEHMLGAIWKRALGQLSGPSLILQTMLAFMNYKGVHESVLCNGGKYLGNDFAFLRDNMEYVSSSSAL
jgi:hypothetical protein